MSKVKSGKAAAKKKRKSGDQSEALMAALETLVHRLRSGFAMALGAGAVVAVLAFAVMWAGGYLGTFADGIAGAAGDGARGAGYEVARVTIVGRKETGPADLEEAIGPLVGKPTLSVDLEAVRRRVEALGWVEAAAVRRLLPDTVQVSIRERTPSAVWQNKGALHLIDQSGVIIRPVFGPEYAQLPLIVGAGAPEAASEILPAIARRKAVMERATALT
ncbi:MAG: FtsQ-type POTRA domain-containing protein, partial [Parvularculaceae bacterium]|nr:FtsQ-type POTRA domain-containing protein [Parvularculaceae bacterium]